MALMLDRRFAPFFWTQFLGAFTDNAFKQALILMITFRGTMSEAETGMLIALASGLFILPYFLFSPLAGQISDKFEKASIMRNVKLLEIVIMILAAIGFAMAGTGVAWADSYLIAILFLMGTQSTFFGPVKYSIIPQHVRDEELMEATALVESGTFVAILAGTIVGGILIMQSVHFVGASLIALAVAGWLSSRKIPFAAPSNPKLAIRWNWLYEYKNLYRVSNQKPSVFLSIVGISWFWFLGAMVMAQLPNFVKLFVRGDESVYILFLSLFTLSIAIGSVLTNLLSDTTVELGMVPLGALGLTLSSFDIGLLEYSKLPEGTLTIANLLANGADPLVYRIIFDVCGMGIAGSFFTVPLYALLQHRTAPETRSQVIAANNIAGAIFMVASAVIVSALYASGFDTAQLFLVLATLNSVVGVYLLITHPEFVLRFESWILGLTRYRVRYIGRRNIPREGACLLYANRIGWLDWPLITAACERPVRFVFEANQHSGVSALILRNWFGAIALGPERDAEWIETAANEIDRALTAGEVVCLFTGRAAEGLANRVPLAARLEPILARMPVQGIPLALRGVRRNIKVAIGEAQPEVASCEALATASHELLTTS
ncbi:MAG: MFS transporter [Deltaproteobacteria bacterium]|nr:MFS transporter [Deltaproteobacteria bacterium]MBW2725313.1 MFS transporter [Deltaproteobacteria bacterium]